MKFLLKTALKAKMLQENEENAVEHINHVGDRANNTTMHTLAELTLAHSNRSFGDLIAAVNHFDNEIGIGKLGIIIEAGVFFDDAAIETLEAGKWVGDALTTKDANEKRENLLTETTEEGTFIARVLEIARTDDDVGFGADSSLIELGGFGGDMLAIGIELDSVIIIIGCGILKTSLDRPGITKVENIIDARNMMRGDDFAGGISGVIVDDKNVGSSKIMLQLSDNRSNTLGLIVGGDND